MTTTLEELLELREIYTKNMRQLAMDGKPVEAGAYLPLIEQLDRDIAPLQDKQYRKDIVVQLEKQKELYQKWLDAGQPGPPRPPPTMPKW